MYVIGLITIFLNSLVQSAPLDSYASVVLHDDLSLFYGDESSLSSPPSTTGAIGINIEHELSNDSTVYYIEQQRYGADWIAAGIYENDSSKIDKGLDILNWVFDKIQDSDDDGSSVYRNSGDAVHSTSLFLEAATRAALLLSHSGLHSDVITSWESHLSDMASFVAEHSAIGAYARDSNLEPFAHRYFLRAAGLQGVSVLFGEEAGSLSVAASSLVQEGLSLQTEDGVFPERGGFDFNYQGIGLAYLGRYQQMIESVDTSAASSSACSASQSLFADRVDSLGNVDTSDSTRINEPARSGRPKRLDYKTIAQGFISCSLASNDAVYDGLAILMARPIRPTVEYRFEGEADGQKSTGLDDDAAHLFCRTADNAKNFDPLGMSGSGLTYDDGDFALKLTSTGSSMGSGQGTFCRTDSVSIPLMHLRALLYLVITRCPRS